MPAQARECQRQGPVPIARPRFCTLVSLVAGEADSGVLPREGEATATTTKIGDEQRSTRGMCIGDQSQHEQGPEECHEEAVRLVKSTRRERIPRTIFYASRTRAT